MGQLRIYISCPISIPYHELQKRAELVSERGKHHVKYWDRKEHYNSDILNKADLVLFLLPDNMFGVYKGGLPAGLRSELRRAEEKGIRIGLLYTTNNGVTNVYRAECTSDYIKGVAGTAGYHNRVAPSDFFREEAVLDLYVDDPPKKSTLAEAQEAVKKLSYTGNYQLLEHGDRRLLLLA